MFIEIEGSLINADNVSEIMYSNNCIEVERFKGDDFLFKFGEEGKGWSVFKDIKLQLRDKK